MALALRRSRPRELNNVIMKATSTLFFHHLSNCSAILGDVAYGQDLEQHEMVVSIDAEHMPHLASTFRSMHRRQNQGTLIGRFYRVSGILMTLKPAGGDTQYFLDAMSIAEYRALSIPQSIYHGLPIVDVNTPEEIQLAVQDPDIHRDETRIVLENEAHLIEAAFGCIKLFRGAARTVIDEPFILKAVQAYFQENDPVIFAAVAVHAMLYSTNASVHGNKWETCLAPIFVETFKTRPLSSWPLLGNSTLPDSLAGDVTIVEYNEQESKLAISHSTITTQEFMETHIKNESKHRIQDIPPFNIPTPHISGPDIVFYVEINGNFHPCFEQLKIRQFLEGSDVEKALATVSSHAMQEKMDKEQEKMQKDQKKQQKQRQ
ncbi:MAG: hypothetical protein BYD32DRAFT_484838 [Podila humilis]|nr:MAG: hypothetical protein BYD32DRAFT_484838 [Podila humilis]